MRNYKWINLSENEKTDLLARPVQGNDEALTKAVHHVMEEVCLHGDDAVLNFTEKFDGVRPQTLCLSEEDINAAIQKIGEEEQKALQIAYNNIKAFHEKQKIQSYEVETTKGIICKSMIRPLERVGVYIPGGTAPLVSTTLMLCVPAQIAGCSDIVFCTPPQKEGINPHILYAASLCGIKTVYQIGGAQAIAAMAYGTQTVPKVDKICGPGNAYVTKAKQLAALDANGAALDLPAGPSEVLVIADETADPDFVAADLLSQAEHDVSSQVIFITTSSVLYEKVEKALEVQLAALPRHNIAKAAMDNSVGFIVDTLDEAVQISNIYAPEHLIINIERPERLLQDVQNAGSVFMGCWTPESFGDYASGTNHVLPTYGYARNYSGLTVRDFMKTITVQHATREGLEELGPVVETLASLEGLDAHKRAVSIRLAKKEEK